MDKIKAFFNKKKQDAKFKKLGDGHKLSSKDLSGASSSKPARQPPEVSYKSADTEQAAQAALKRLQISQQGQQKTPSRSSQAIKAEAKRQLEAERKTQELASSTSASSSVSRNRGSVEFETAPVLAVSGVYFTCDLLSDDVCLPKKDMQIEVENFLRQSLIDDDAVVASAIMIHSLNGTDPEKRQSGIDVLCKYLQNIIATPDEEKYRRIKKSNRIFQEKVVVLKGALEFLSAVGFEEVVQNDEAYYVLPPTQANSSDLEERLKVALDCLINGQPVPLKLYRDPQILPPNARPLADLSLPVDFFDRTVDEIRNEQKERAEQLEKMLTLRTREMRERDELRAVCKYKYCVVRIRTPDGCCLQGTFKSAEKLSAVVNFVRDYMVLDWAPCVLKESFGEILSGVKMEKTLAELKFSPAVLLHLELDADFLSDYLANHQSLPDHYLKQATL